MMPWPPSAMRCASRETSSRVGIQVGRAGAHLALDPAFDLAIDLEHLAPRGLDHRSDHDFHQAGLLAERVARPYFAGVVRDRKDRSARARGEQRSPDAIAPLYARRDASALGKDRDPVSLAQPLGPLLDDLLARARAARAVDRDGADRHEPPAHEGQPQELLLHDP